jgi:hypothetical protein
MADQLIDDYVRDLRTSAWIRQLPKSRTEDLEDDVRERIEADLAAAGNRDAGTAHRVLDRMGPASAIIDAQSAAPPTGLRRALTPVIRLRFLLSAHGWGIAEIGGLLLLVFGPFLVWWIGPIFGIILIRYAADRWSPRAMRIATGVVFGLLATQAFVALGTLGFLLISDGNLDAEETRRLMSGFNGGQLFQDAQGHGDPLAVVRIVGGLLAPVAGIGSAIYLALSPRYRPAVRQVWPPHSAKRGR